MIARMLEEPDDEPGPALQTPRRLAGQIERIYLDLARARGRLVGVSCYLESPRARELGQVLDDVVDSLAELRGRILSGDAAIVVGRDDASWRERQPLIDLIERKGHAEMPEGEAKKPRARRPRAPRERSKGSGKEERPRATGRVEEARSWST
jgi:hypothetical protein